MTLFLATEYRLVLSNNRYYAYSKFATILKRYYNNFGEIVICTRINTVTSVSDEKLQDITSCISKVIPISLLKTLLHLENRRILENMAKCDLVVGRFDSIVSCRAASCAKKLKKPFLAELMADAWDGYWNHGLLGKIIAPYMFYATKAAVKNANYALYVTREFLQKRYPCAGYTTNVSNVLITGMNDEDVKKRYKKIESGSSSELVLMTTAAVDVVAKGHEYVIKAIPLLNKKGIRVKYLIVGGGNQGRLRIIASKVGVLDQIQFLGELSLQDVFTTIEKCDIYIQPSLQEGLPRSVIEAMSKGCPCIGARTAGIPELLPQECVFRRQSSDSIANVIINVFNKEKLKCLSRYSFEAAKDYQDDVLSKRRNDFYDRIKTDLIK